MKKLILVAAMAAMYVQVKAQTVVEVKTVPQPVITTFQTSYPDMNNVVWEKDGTYYIAEYKTDDNDRYVRYEPSGRIIEQGEGMKESDLPANANTYVKTKYKGNHMKKVYKVKDSNGHTIWKAKVNEDYVMFDENGNPMKMKRDK
jgi:hypothetical protein